MDLRTGRRGYCNETYVGDSPASVPCMRFARRLYLPFYAAGIFPYLSYAASLSPEDYLGKPIEQIRFEPARQPFTPDELRKILPFDPLAPLDPAKVRAAIKALYATGRFS